MSMETELSIAIVKGKVGDYAVNVAQSEGVSFETLAMILRKLADLLEEAK